MTATTAIKPEEAAGGIQPLSEGSGQDLETPEDSAAAQEDFEGIGPTGSEPIANETRVDKPEEPHDGNENVEDDDDVTVILLDLDDNANEITLDWIEQQGPEMEQRRRTVLLREVKRIQRASFCHFALLCAVPIVLLIIVLAAVIRGDASCTSTASECALEPRSFVNAFTTRCVCEPIPVVRGEG
jgi:hypothetical protein